MFRFCANLDGNVKTGLKNKYFTDAVLRTSSVLLDAVSTVSMSSAQGLIL